MCLVPMNGAIEEQAIDNGFTVIDTYDAFEKNAHIYTHILYFDIHPNAVGHALIKDMILEQCPFVMGLLVILELQAL